MSGPPIRRGPPLDRNGRGVFEWCEVLAGRAYSSTALSGWQAAICITCGSAYVPRMKPLPPTFAANAFKKAGSRFRPANGRAGRTFERKELRAVDSGALGASPDNDAPIVLRLASLPSVTA